MVGHKSQTPRVPSRLFGIRWVFAQSESVMGFFSFFSLFFLLVNLKILIPPPLSEWAVDFHPHDTPIHPHTHTPTRTHDSKRRFHAAMPRMLNSFTGFNSTLVLATVTINTHITSNSLTVYDCFEDARPSHVRRYRPETTMSQLNRNTMTDITQPLGASGDGHTIVTRK